MAFGILSGIKALTRSFDKSAFGPLSVTMNDPDMQIDAQYNTTGALNNVETNGGTGTVSGGEFQGASGPNANAIGSIFSEQPIIFRPGQGGLIRFDARFPSNNGSSLQTAGGATSVDSVTFGYFGTTFGTTYRRGGRVIIEELQITTPAGGAESTTITVNGVAFTVPITAGTVQQNAHEIAVSLSSQTDVFFFTQNDDTVVMRSTLAGNETGAFTFSSPGAAAGSFTTIDNGLFSTSLFTPQAGWNRNPKPDLDQSKYNNYSIQLDGSLSYFITDQKSGDNVLVHQAELPNTAENPMFSKKALRVAWTSFNFFTPSFSTTVFGTYGAGFSQGTRRLVGEFLSDSANNPSVGTTLTNMITIRCREVLGTSVNLGRVIPIFVNASTDGNKGAVVEIVKNAVPSGNTNFQYIDKVNSIAEVDKTANTLTGGTRIGGFVLGAGGVGDFEKFNDFILSSNTISIGMRVPSAAAAEMNCSFVWDEDI